MRLFLGTDPTNRRPMQIHRTMDAKNRSVAQRQLKAWQQVLEQDPTPVLVTGAHVTVRGLIEEWLVHSEARGRSPRTLHDARRSAETVIYPEFGNTRISKLTPRDLDEWYRKLSTGEGRSRPLKATSIRRHHAVLSSALSQAVRWGWIDRSPADRAQPPTMERTELKVPTPDEVRKLLAGAKACHERWGMLLSLAVLTGARRGELCALRWSDVNDDSIQFRRSPLPGRW